jgi:hypothetical protein
VTELDSIRATGSKTIDGVKWVVYDNRSSLSSDDSTSYGLESEFGSSKVVLAGTASPKEFETVARALSSQIRTQHTDGSTEG